MYHAFLSEKNLYFLKKLNFIENSERLEKFLAIFVFKLDGSLESWDIIFSEIQFCTFYD